MIIRPYGYALWENVSTGMDDRIKATGHQNSISRSLFLNELSEKRGGACGGVRARTGLA